MAERHVRSPGRFITLEPCLEDGVLQLKEVGPLPPKEPTIPRSQTRNTIGRIGGKRNKSKRPRERGPSSSPPRVIRSYSALDSREPDRPIDIGTMKHDLLDSESSGIPIVVHHADNSSQGVLDSDVASNASLDIQLSAAQTGRTDHMTSSAGHFATSLPTMTASDGPGNEYLNLAGHQSLQLEHHNYLTAGNSLGLNLFPPYQADSNQNATDAPQAIGVARESLSWSQDERHNQPSSNASWMQNSIHLTSTRSDTECSHAYEVIWTFRCTVCGCHVPFDAFQSVPAPLAQDHAVYRHADYSGVTGYYSLVAPNQVTEYGVARSFNGFPFMTQYHNTMSNFSGASTSEPSPESTNDRQLANEGGAWQTQSQTNAPLTRLMIPDAAYYRQPPSAVSASASSPASSVLQSTPASEISHDLLSPPFGFSNLDTLSLAVDA